MPGFELGGNSNWSYTQAGVVIMNFSTTKAGEPLALVRARRWRHPRRPVAPIRRHVRRAECLLLRGRAVGRPELDQQHGRQCRPSGLLESPSARPRPSRTRAIGFSVALDEVRVSNVALTPTQVKAKFENYVNYASTYYVSTTGLSTNTGTSSSPWELTTGLAHATANTKIILSPGTYNGNQFQITNSGDSPLRNVLITGAVGSSQAIISVSGSTQGARSAPALQYACRGI